MEQQNLQSFLEKAEVQLAGIRGGLLLAAQNGFSARDIQIAADRIDALRGDAASCGLNSVSDTVTQFVSELRSIASADTISHNEANRSLDIIARIEAAYLETSFRSDGFLADVEELVEFSFSQLGDVEASQELEDFEIDEETLEIFRSEADGLLANIAANVKRLGTSPGDAGALWEIRRNAHTFKGAAGIVGFKAACSLAHRVEDLLDQMVESHRQADNGVIELLANATDHMAKLSSGISLDQPAVEQALSRDFNRALASLAAGTNGPPLPVASEIDRSASDRVETRTQAPIVRVSLERLADLLNIARDLIINSSALVDRLDQASIAGSEDLLESQRRLSDEILQKLLDIRMVRFGTMETRLKRSVHVTCQEEDKKVGLSIRGGEVEIDTQTIDALIEPLLHLLKNAVVHGIESAETRRLLGKPEKGQIEIDVTATDGELFVTVSDDGKGISTEKLVKKAVASNIVTAEAARQMTEQDAIELIFHRGLTTAESLSMNAGRGVGMSIVRQSVESQGGTLAVTSEPQKGALFTITMPVAQPTTKSSPQPVDQIQPTGVPLVLIVDDSSSIRRQMSRFVEDAGLRAITAVDGADALELLLNGSHEPDLILSDVEMPNMNGWEFLEYVKTDDNLGHVPVVMVTSLDSDEYRQMASKLGASDYIVKPFGPKDLENVFAKFCAVPA